MLHIEATRLCQIVLGLGDVSPLLNLGSSTRLFRETTKPHIDRLLFAPLRQAGVSVVHSDLKEGDGVDLVGDLLDPAMLERFKAGRFRCILLSNVLEHVRDRAAVAAACEEIVGPGGHVLASAPSNYPYHADPIDTGYRPSPTELAGTFSRSRALIAEEITDRTFAEDLKAKGISAWRELARTALWALVAPVRPKSFAARVHRWRWYSRPWRVSIALVEVLNGGQ